MCYIFYVTYSCTFGIFSGIDKYLIIRSQRSNNFFYCCTLYFNWGVFQCKSLPPGSHTYMRRGWKIRECLNKFKITILITHFPVSYRFWHIFIDFSHANDHISCDFQTLKTHFISLHIFVDLYWTFSGGSRTNEKKNLRWLAQIVSQIDWWNRDSARFPQCLLRPYKSSRQRAGTTVFYFILPAACTYYLARCCRAKCSKKIKAEEEAVSLKKLFTTHLKCEMFPVDWDKEKLYAALPDFLILITCAL